MKTKLNCNVIVIEKDIIIIVRIIMDPDVLTSSERVYLA